MTDHPYLTLSCAVSLDGYLDTAAPPRLLLSNAADFDRVDEVRSQNDAILVGARTVRRDNPHLLVRSTARQLRREGAGLTRSPWKVTVTASGDLDPQAAFFADGATTKLVYCPSSKVRRIRRRLGTAATVVGLGDQVTMTELVADLSDRGVRRLMVEGGGTVLTQFLAANLADELHMAVAPLLIGDRRAPRLVADGALHPSNGRRVTLVEARPIGDVVLLRYALSDRIAPPAAVAADSSAVRSLVMRLS